MPELITELPNIGRIGRKRTGLLTIIAVMLALVLVACTESKDPTATSAPPTAQPLQKCRRPQQRRLQHQFLKSALVANLKR